MSRSFGAPVRSGQGRLAAALLFLATLAACQAKDDGAAVRAATQSLHEQTASLALGELAGADATDPYSGMENALRHNNAAVAEGHRLFVAMNCAGCHAYDARGAMGPDLTDPLWRYGGTAGGIYRSIFEGRPQGMPAWGHSLPAEEIWELTAYVQSLGGAVESHSYHAGLQGDHDLTSTAPEAHDFDGGATAPIAPTARAN